MLFVLPNNIFQLDISNNCFIMVGAKILPFINHQINISKQVYVYRYFKIGMKKYKDALDFQIELGKSRGKYICEIVGYSLARFWLLTGPGTEWPLSPTALDKFLQQINRSSLY